jgi:hypothetical protein
LFSQIITEQEMCLPRPNNSNMMGSPFSVLRWNALSLCILCGAGISLLGCRTKIKPGQADVPPGTPAKPSETFRDLCPRWSHDGRRIAFLRSTDDRRMQLCVTDARLKQISSLLKPEILSPDRAFGSELARYTAPNSLAWSPDDTLLAFPRMDWFTFDDGERLPGAGLWSINVQSGRVTPLATHPPRYAAGFYTYRSPRWSPNGKFLAFTGEGVNGQRVLFVRSLQAHSPQEVASRFDHFDDTDGAVWESNVTTPALIYRRKIRRTPQSPTTDTLRRMVPGSTDGARTGELWRITTPALYAHRTGKPAPSMGEKFPPELHTLMPRLGHIAVSPDGKQIAFSVTSQPTDMTQYEIAVYDSENGKVHFATPPDGKGYFAPVWVGNRRLGMLSPNGRNFDVCLLTRSRQTPIRLGTIDSSDCDWSPDRSRIVYAAKLNKTTAQTTLKLFFTGISAPTPAQ